MKDKKIVQVDYTPAIKVLNEAKLGILGANWLENRNFNITTQLSHIYKVFTDFKLIAQIREEIEKVKPSLALTT